MDFTKLISQAAGGKPEKPTSDKPAEDSSHSSAPSSAQLFSSAKVVADAAQTTLRDGADKLDKGRVAGAGADLLGAASHYGKLEEKGFGQYVEKAEDYLHQYHTTQSCTPAAAAAAPAAGHPPASTDHKPASKSGDGAASDQGGSGDYLKMAQGFLKKN